LPTLLGLVKGVMMRRWIIASCLAVSTLSAHAERELSRLLEPRPAAVSDEVAAGYAAAMAASASIVPGEGMPLLSMRTRWMWIAPDGKSVQRVAENTFRWRSGNCLDGFCKAVDCFVGLWPDLVCADGEPRTIAAPDLATVVLDGVTFKRDIP
jgi:hypothetical protein